MYASIPIDDQKIARSAFFCRSFPTCGPTFSAESRTNGPETVLAWTQALTASETPSAERASAGAWKSPSCERRAMIRSAACV